MTAVIIIQLFLSKKYTMSNTDCTLVMVSMLDVRVDEYLN